MTCVILRPDPQTLFNQIKDMFSTTVLGGGTVIPESNEWYVVSNDYAMAEQYFAIADQLWREANPATACCDALYAMAAQRGMFPKPAVSAQGYAKLTGLPGSAIPPSFEISTETGTYVSVGTVPLTIPPEGTIIVRVQALIPGTDMNASAGSMTGTLTTAAPGIDSTVTICGGQFCGGTNAEDCEQFRQRYLTRLAYSPHTDMAWAKAKLAEFPCSTRVCIREGACCRCNNPTGSDCYNCGTRMEFYVLFDDAFPCGIPPQHVVDDINDWFFGVHQGYGEGQVPIGVCGKIYAPIPLMVDVIIDIEGCPTAAQQQIISDQITAFFKTICPSLPVRVKQLELIIAMVIGVQVNSSVRFELVDGFDRSKVWVTACGDLEPECDVLPCLRNITFTRPNPANAPC